MNTEELERIIKKTIEQTQNNQNSITLEAWMLTYNDILLERKYSLQTTKNKKATLNHIVKAFGTKSLTDIKPIDISKMLSTFSAHSASRILGELRDIYFEAIANGVTLNNPAVHLKAPKQKLLRKRLTIEVYHQILERSFDYSIPWVTNMLLLALATGQRRGDLVKMRFDDIVDGHLRVEQQKKAGKEIGARLSIPLNIKVCSIGCTLGDIIELCKQGKQGATLLRKSNGGSLEISSLSARFRELITNVLPKDSYQTYEWPSLHEVRSLAARTYVAENMPSDTIQVLLGHMHSEMTDTYLNDRGLNSLVWKVVNV